MKNTSLLTVFIVFLFFIPSLQGTKSPERQMIRAFEKTIVKTVGAQYLPYLPKDHG